jgi:hypothetical protein
MKIKDFKLGATGRYPYGKSRPDDEGELAAAIATDYTHGIIRIEFGKSVAWLALTAQLARDMAAELIKRADELDAKRS